MMKRKVFLNGSVFQFYVPEIKKYAFCRFYDFREVSSFHGLLAQVFDLFKDSEDNSIDELQYADWLFGHRSMYKWPILGKEKKWKFLGTTLVSDYEFIPDFKGVQAAITVVEDEAKIGPWYAIHNLTERSENKDYKKVAHLERKILTTSGLGLVWRTGMEYCRINGLKIDEFYDLNDSGIKDMFFQMINVPVYSTIPKEMRGRALK